MDPQLVESLTSYIPQVIPEAVLAAFACVLFLGGTWSTNRRLWGLVSLMAMALAGCALWYTATRVPLDSVPSYSAPLWHSRLTIFVKIIALAGGVLLLLFSWDEMPASRVAEHHACLLLITAGVGLSVAANELITLFLSLELVSIPTYVLLYLSRSDAPAQEAAMKYFLLSVFSSALLLFGFSYLYGVAGTTNLPTITEAVAVARANAALRGLPLIALVMVVAGLGFRFTAVPFHFYAPDVYQGTATPSAALLAFVPKVAGFLALGRVIGLIPLMPLSIVGDNAPYFLWILAVVTMSLGNMVALMQNNVKRLLAYSSVAHAGYMLIGLSVAPHLGTSPDAPIGGVEALLFYLVAYGAMTIGAFAILTWVSSPTRPVETVEDLSGLGRSRPGSALLMTLFLFSLVGLPLTAGFMGKLFLFLGALRVPYSPDNPAQIENARLFTTLVIVAAVNSAIGGWYYLRLVAVMYLRDSLAPAEPRRPRPVLATILVCAAITLAAGVYPAPLTDAVKSAVRESNQAPAPAPTATASPQMFGD